MTWPFEYQNASLEKAKLIRDRMPTLGGEDKSSEEAA